MKWEEAILDVIRKNGGIASLNEIYLLFPNTKIKTNSENINHNIRAFLERLIKKNKLIRNADNKFEIINSTSKHKNYEILNLLGYGLAKFDKEFINQFGFNTKSSFFEYFVNLGIVETGSVVKNRMDLFDNFFENGRKGWWQKGDAYIHRKVLIDSLFGSEKVEGYANIVKLFLKDEYHVKDIVVYVKPIVKSRFKKLQETGLEAELYFMKNYEKIDIFENGSIEDARLFGDGYDFQISVNERFFLAEIKGIRLKKGRFRLTENEYKKAKEYKSDYIVTLVLNLDELPKFLTIANPLENLEFEERVITSKELREYHLKSDIC